MLHGAYLAIHKLISDKFPSLKNNWFFNSKIGKIVSILITQYFVFLAWIPFRVRDVDDMLYSMNKYVFLDFQTVQFMQQFFENRVEIAFLVLFVFLSIISFLKPGLIKKISELKLRHWTVIITLILFVIVFFFDGNANDFIYFRF